MNEKTLPLEHFDFNSLIYDGQVLGSEASRATVSGTCGNCGRQASEEKLTVCTNHHLACSQCLLQCASCQAALCLKCQTMNCSVCKQTMCHKCVVRCSGCGMFACREHNGKCAVCGLSFCADCLVNCDRCGGSICMAHMARAGSQLASPIVCGKCASGS